MNTLFIISPSSWLSNLEVWQHSLQVVMAYFVMDTKTTQYLLRRFSHTDSCPKIVLCLLLPWWTSSVAQDNLTCLNPSLFLSQYDAALMARCCLVVLTFSNCFRSPSITAYAAKSADFSRTWSSMFFCLWIKLCPQIEQRWGSFVAILGAFIIQVSLTLPYVLTVGVHQFEKSNLQ